MQSKTTMRYHLTPIRMAAIKNKKIGNNKCCQGCGKLEPGNFALLVGLYDAMVLYIVWYYISYGTIENSIVVPQKIKNRSSI